MKMPRLVDVILDTSYAIALSSPEDEYYSKADEIGDQMAADRTRVVTTRAVFLEIGNALGKKRFRGDAVTLLMAMERDTNVEIVPLSEALYARAFQLYSARPDKEWGLIDCVSITVMQDRKISAALTADEHFQQAGFRALLWE
jgi:predicted nucleic acid-binding protein